MHNSVLRRHIATQNARAGLVVRDVRNTVFDRKVELGARGGGCGGCGWELGRVDHGGEDLLDSRVRFGRKARKGWEGLRGSGGRMRAARW